MSQRRRVAPAGAIGAAGAGRETERSLNAAGLRRIGEWARARAGAVASAFATEEALRDAGLRESPAPR
jgi:hypothetical protein